MSKNKKGKVVPLTPRQFSPENYIKTQARALPVVECLITKEWDESGISNIVVARRHKSGNITAGIYLVDMYCLGVKDAHYEFNMDPEEYEYLKENCGDVEECEYVLAHNIIYGAIAYADDYGFKPDPDFAIAQYLLEEDNDEVPLLDIEFGCEGQPCYVPGPYDDEAKIKSITAILNRTAGPGNFTVVDLEDDDFDDDDFGEFDFNDLDDDDLEDDDFDDELDDLAAEIEAKGALHQTLLKKINRAYDIVIRGKDPKSPVVTPVVIGAAYKVSEGPVKNEFTLFDNDAQEAEYNRVRQILMSGELDKGLKAAKKAIEKYPSHVAFRDLILSVHINNGDHKKAEQTVRETYKLFPGVLMPLVGYANMLLQEGKATEALALFEGKKDLNDLYPNRKLYHVKEAGQYYACMCRLHTTLGDFDAADLYMNGIFNKQLVKRAQGTMVNTAIDEMLSAKFKLIQQHGPYTEGME